MSTLFFFLLFLLLPSLFLFIVSSQKSKRGLRGVSMGIREVGGLNPP